MTDPNREIKYEAILYRAASLDAKGKTETFRDLAKWLNSRGFTNQNGLPYASNPRGIAKVVVAAWEHALEQHGEQKALPIANSFTRDNGEYAWTE